MTDEGRQLTLQHLAQKVGLPNVRAWHCNDAKADRGSRLDRHEHIGRGKLGLPVFRALLNDDRLKHAAFIAETPIDEPGDDLRNVETLKSLVENKVRKKVRKKVGKEGSGKEDGASRSRSRKAS